MCDRPSFVLQNVQNPDGTVTYREVLKEFGTLYSTETDSNKEHL